MVNRLIRYGYKLLDGKLVPDENEALIVMEIFQKYVNGNSLKSIAEELNVRGIIYLGEKCGWNKRRIASMIEEQKYIGEKDYPKLISNELFEAANIVKNRKSFKPKVCSNEVDACKTIVYCGQCGKAMHRKSLWDTREKWICNGGCKCSKYMDDNEIIWKYLIYFIRQKVYQMKRKKKLKRCHCRNFVRLYKERGEGLI